MDLGGKPIQAFGQSGDSAALSPAILLARKRLRAARSASSLHSERGLFSHAIANSASASLNARRRRSPIALPRGPGVSRPRNCGPRCTEPNPRRMWTKICISVVPGYEQLSELDRKEIKRQLRERVRWQPGYQGASPAAGCRWKTSRLTCFLIPIIQTYAQAPRTLRPMQHPLPVQSPVIALFALRADHRRGAAVPGECPVVRPARSPA